MNAGGGEKVIGGREVVHGDLQFVFRGATKPDPDPSLSWFRKVEKLLQGFQIYSSMMAVSFSLSHLRDKRGNTLHLLWTRGGWGMAEYC